MIIFVHMLIAFSSIAFTGYTLLTPSNTKLIISYLLVAATLISGTFMVITTGGSLVHACTAGIIYTGIVFYGIAIARNRLAEARNRISND